MNSSSKPQPWSNRPKEKAESLLQAFQSSSRRNPAATPRPPSMSPHPITPGHQTKPTYLNGHTNQQQSTPAAVTTPKKAETSPAVRQLTPTPKAGKRVLRTPFFEGNSSDENTSEGSNTHNHDPGAKRRRVAASKPGDVSTKQPVQSVEKDQDSSLFVPQTVEPQPQPAQKAAITATASPKKPTPPSQSIPNLVPQVNMPARQPNPAASSVPTAQASDRQSVVQRLSTESKRVANDIAQKNSAFLGSFPAGSSSHVEAKLDEIAKELFALHQQKVEALKGEYIAKLQKEMSECQKMIGILQQQTPEQGL